MKLINPQEILILTAMIDGLLEFYLFLYRPCPGEEDTKSKPLLAFLFCSDFVCPSIVLLVTHLYHFWYYKHYICVLEFYIKI